jgi:hypothetical protein
MGCYDSVLNDASAGGKGVSAEIGPPPPDTALLTGGGKYFLASENSSEIYWNQAMELYGDCLKGVHRENDMSYGVKASSWQDDGEIGWDYWAE